MQGRILVIEDNSANLELMVYLLAAFGHTTYAAMDGEEGVAAALREQPDLIICDVQMPKLDGYGVVRELKSRPACASIPVIAVTALAMVGDRDRILVEGFDGYLAKPIDPENFVGQVDAFLHESQRRARPVVVARYPPVAAAPVPVRTGAKILVVDNVPANIQLARSLLEPSGFQIVTATGGREALVEAGKHLPDLIISDIGMENGNGYEFIRRVKAISDLAAIPFIFLTSTMLREEDRNFGLAMGAARFLFRPLEPQDLLDEIRACLAEFA